MKEVPTIVIIIAVPVLMFSGLGVYLMAVALDLIQVSLMTCS